jgi:hypothetical protein
MFDAETAYTHTLKCQGYPITTWLRVTYANKDEPFCSPCNIVLIEQYADAACTKVLSQDDNGASYSPEQIEAINIVVRCDIAERTFREQTTKQMRLAQARRAADALRGESVPSLLQRQAG